MIGHSLQDKTLRMAERRNINISSIKAILSASETQDMSI